MSKNQVKAWFRDLGCECRYSGSTKTMYIKGMSQRHIDYFGISTKFTLVEYTHPGFNR